MGGRREVNPEAAGSRHHPRKHDVGSERLEEFRTDTRDAVESRKPAKGTVLLAPGDDALRERRTDSGEARDLRHVGSVEVDALPWQERAREPGGGSGG